MQSPSYFFGVIKILEKPKKKVFKDKIILNIRALVPQRRKTNSSRIVSLIFWKTLTADNLNSYQVNEYIFIEGYVSIELKKSLNLRNLTSKNVSITVLKAVPFFFKSDNSINKI